MTATPGVPSMVPRSCDAADHADPELDGQLVATTWVRAWRSGSDSDAAGGLSAATPKTAASASRTATALTAT